MTLDVMLDKARAYKSAQKHSEDYLSSFHQKSSFTTFVSSNKSTEISTTSAAIPNRNNSSKIKLFLSIKLKSTHKKIYS